MSQKHYIDNKEFYEEMKKYISSCKEAEKNNQEYPQITEYIGRCFLEISERLSHRPNFVNYTFREEMVGDGIENCIQYVKNFDPDKSKNPFAYFTQIIYYAFLRRIQKEKKQLYIKYKTMDNMRLLEDVSDIMNADQNTYVQDTLKYDQQLTIYDFIDNFEETKKSKKKPPKKKKVKEESKIEYFSNNA